MKQAKGLRKVAAAAGVSIATVSLALRAHPRISPDVRRLVVKVAEKIGYRLDPTVSEMMRRLRAPDPAAYKGTIAYLAPKDSSCTADANWRRRMLETARRQAERLGYRLATFALEGGAMSPERLSQVLRARGIAGVVVAPLQQPTRDLPFRWDWFSAVAVGHSLARPRMHRVGRSLFHPLLAVVEQLHQADYRRVGLCVDTRENDRMQRVLEAAAKVFAPPGCDAAAVPPLPIDRREGVRGRRRSRREIRAWLQAHRPDVVLGDYWVWDMLVELGHEIPRDIGFATWNRDFDDTVCAGIYACFEELAAAAVDVVVAAVQSGEIGVPERPRLVLIEGDWRWGATLRERPPKLLNTEK